MIQSSNASDIKHSEIRLLECPLSRHPDVEKGLRYGLGAPTSSILAVAGWFRHLKAPANATLVQRLPKLCDGWLISTPVYDEFSKTGFCGAMPRIRAVSKSAIEPKTSKRKW